MSHKLQRGFSLVTAIFLLVVLAGLGAAMLTFSTAQHQGVAIDILGSRAYQAARAGVEWSAYQIIKASSVSGGLASNCRAGNSAASVVMPAGQLSSFTVNVGCSISVHSDVTTATADSTEEIGDVYVYSISSVAFAGTLGEADYVERQIKASIAQ